MSSGRWRLGAQRDRAERYLVITIAAFAVTVGGVRWYLDTAGYPTVGGGELHVAHVLWGGLALFIAALLPLLLDGRRALLISALLAGIGAGLFIDEVGKFLTSTNDYFYAPAAPIIYGSILLLVLLWLIIRRQSASDHDVTHVLLEALRDGVDGNLTAVDRQRAIDLQREAEEGRPDDPDSVPALLVRALTSPSMDQQLAAEGWVARGDARRLFERLLPTRLERWLLYLSLLMAVLTALVAALLLVASTQIELGDINELVEDAGRLEFPSEPIWILLSLAVNVVVGVAAVVALALLARGRTRRGLNAALVALLTSLVAGGLVTYYAAQFTALTSTVLVVLQLGLVLDLRIRTSRASVDDADD